MRVSTADCPVVRCHNVDIETMFVKCPFKMFGEQQCFGTS